MEGTQDAFCLLKEKVVGEPTSGKEIHRVVYTDAWKQVMMETMKEGSGRRPRKYGIKNYKLMGLRVMLGQELGRNGTIVKGKEW